MRELIYFVASLAGAAVLAAGAQWSPVFWRRVLVVASVLFCVCAAWIAADFLSENGMGNSIGLSLPLWARGLIGAVAGAAIWIGITSYHPAEAQMSAKDKPAAMTIENSGGGTGADVSVTGRAGQPAPVGLDVAAAPSGMGLKVIQSGPGTGLKVTVGGNGPAVGVRVNVGGQPPGQ
jgi:hypothetical protein